MIGSEKTSDQSGGFDPEQGGFDFGQGFGNQGMEFDLGDIMDQMFGGGRQKKTDTKRGRDIEVELNLDLKDVLVGKDREITLDKMIFVLDVVGLEENQGLK